MLIQHNSYVNKVMKFRKQRNWNSIIENVLFSKKILAFFFFLFFYVFFSYFSFCFPMKQKLYYEILFTKLVSLLLQFRHMINSANKNSIRSLLLFFLRECVITHTKNTNVFISFLSQILLIKVWSINPRGQNLWLFE